MKKINASDYTLIFTVASLLLIGIVAIASVSTMPSQQIFGTPYYYLGRHIIHILMGIMAGFLAFKVKLNLLKKWSVPLLGINLVLLVLVLKFGFSSGGATRWMFIGPIMIQPSEFLKLILIVFLAAWLEKVADQAGNKKKNRKGDREAKKAFIISLSFFLISTALLLAQPDFGTTVIIFSIFAIMYFLTGTPLWHTITLGLGGLASLAILIKIAPYRVDRLLTFLNPDLDLMGKGYQIKQAFIAIGSGGLFGLGLGMSRQKFGFLPETMTDTIFATFAEETGFIGSLLLVSLLILFLWIGIGIIKKSSDMFCSLMSTGIVSWIIIQAFVNIGGVVGVLPFTGIPLPFISYGGSHLLTELTAVGLLLNISKNKRA